MTDVVNRWTMDDTAELYNISRWGAGYLGIDREGHLQVYPDRDPGRAIDVPQLVGRLQADGVALPVLIRFGGILEDRLREIHRAFNRAIREYGYLESYRCVYPVKVNQQRGVVEEVVRFGRAYGFGLEAGSKAELLAVVALADESMPIICNGFKDSEYVEMALRAQQLGRYVLPVIDQLSDLDRILQVAQQLDVRPRIGVRAKLAARGSGRWQTSGGYLAKFGLTANELLTVVGQLADTQLLDRLELVHFHLGSQVTNIRHIKLALTEAARIYVHLYRAGAGLKLLDVGGGLGIDYDGSQTDYASSVNYTLQEYANDVVYHIQCVCDAAGVPHPGILSESGRAVVAYQSMLVFDTLAVARHAGDSESMTLPQTGLPAPIGMLKETLDELDARNARESFHDAQQALDTVITLFHTGHVDLEQRALAENLFWAICRQARRYLAASDHPSEELFELERFLCDTYFGNFSLFQSVPDSWAVKQLFPVLPIQRLHQRPLANGVIADITCDSDGKIDRFVDRREVRRTLPLHPPDGKTYLLAVCLVGAYQEILGDLHNLFGDTHVVHVAWDADEQLKIKQVVQGDTVSDVLTYVGFDVNGVAAALDTAIDAAVRQQKLTPAQAETSAEFYRRALAGYTYLE